MNLLLTMTLSACGLLAGSANAEQPSGPDGPVAIPPTPAAQLGGAVQTADAVPVWPVDARSLERSIPGESLGPSIPLEDPGYGTAYGTRWTLLKPVTISGVQCGSALEVMDGGWQCTLVAAYSFLMPKLTLKAGALVEFDYVTARPNQFEVADIEPATKRVVVDGVACADSVTLDDGKFSRCKLADDRRYGTVIVPAGSDVTDRGGELQIMPSRAFEAGGIAIPADCGFTMDSKGENIVVWEDGFGF